MGIPERRILKQFEEQEFPKWKRMINETAGFDVAMDIDWLSMELNGESHLYMNAIPKVYFMPLIDAIKSVSADAVGTAAIKDGLKRVVINGKTGTTAQAWRFEDGVLNVNHICINNIDDVKDRTDWLIKTFETKLATPGGIRLRERRALNQFQELSYPAIKKQIDAAAGFEVTIEVDWNSLVIEGHSHLFLDAFAKVFFIPILESVKRIATDEIGKDALKACLKKIIIDGTAGSTPRSWIIKEGVLHIRHLTTTNIDTVLERIDWLT